MNDGLVAAKIPQTLFVNSEVTGPMFTKFLHDVEPVQPLLMCALTRRYYIPFQNAKAKNEGGQFRRLQNAPKFIGCYSNVSWATTNFMSN